MTTRTTRAILIERHGPPAVLVERDVPLREVAAGEVRIRVQAAGVNFADLLMRAGLYGTVPPRPYSPGFEVAGEVAEVGSGVEQRRAGDRVVALLRHGGYAADVIVSAGQVFSCPDSLGTREAAAVPVVFLTAWVCLFEAARAREGETVLVLGAGGGVGTAAVQLAVSHGLRVLGTAGNQRKRAFVVEELGAAACFDSQGNWEAEVRRQVGPRGIDIALDPVGGSATSACRRLLAPLGRLVFYGLSQAMPRRKRSWLRAAAAWARTPRFHPLSLVEPNVGLLGVHLLHLQDKETILGPALEEIYRAVASGELRPVVDRVLPLDRAGAVEAHLYLHARSNLGKVVLAAPGSESDP
jgi:NADPH:quinone reductase-like Zn-dependent oxidoreductase